MRDRLGENIDHETIQSWRGRRLGAKVLFARAGVAQQIWIDNDNGAVLFDVGDGALRDILHHQLAVSRIKGIVITHGHYDHVGGLHSLLGFLRMIGREEPLPIAGPKGCIQLFSILDVFRKWYPGSQPFDILPREVRPEEIFELSGMTIKAYPVVHCGSLKGGRVLEQIPAMGYRISCGEDTVAISGDTGMCPALKELVAGADLAIIEATFSTGSDVNKDMLEKVHLTEELAHEVGKLAKEYMLVHKGTMG